MTICRSCNDVLRLADDSLNTIHSTCQSFLAAVNEGCYICHGLFCQLPEELKQGLRRRVETSEPPAKKRRKLDEDYWFLTWYQKDVGNSRSGSIRLDLRMTDPNADVSFETMDIPETPRLFLYPVKKAGGEKLAPAGLPWTVSSSCTSSEETFSKIKAWLDRCGKTHARCRGRRDEADVAWIPTRLVEITSEPQRGDKAEDLMCRVVELKSDNVAQNLKYITLSHRWPQNQQGLHMQKLTVGNLPQWKTSLPVRMLRQVFRDAFLVAQRVGITYVWIDSLCIIQDGDSLADWKRESPMMQKVYSHAVFNICASKIIRDGNGEGLFSPREPSSFQSLQIELFEDNDPVGDLDASESVGHNDNRGHYLVTKRPPITVWDERTNESESPLASRGWIFQEQLLSRANLHFGSPEVYFECLGMRASEFLGSDQDYEVSWKEDHIFFKEHLPIPGCMEKELRAPDESSNSDYNFNKFDGDPYKLWHELLSQYTTRQLTKFDDRLVALSGVAQYFQKFFSHTGNDFYIAGLWHSRLATELLWQMAKATAREAWAEQKRTRNYLTFSWLSVKAQIENQAGKRNFSLSGTPLADVKVVRYRMSPDTGSTVSKEQPFAEDIFSLPSTPTVEVRLTGFLRPMRLERVRLLSEQRMWPGFEGPTDADFDLVLRLGEHSDLRYYEEGGTAGGETMLDFDISSAELDGLNNSGRLFLMPLIKEEPYWLWLLLLELVETGDGVNMGRFRRIGVHNMGIFQDMPGDEWLFSFMQREAIDASYASSLGIYEGVSELPRWRYNDNLKRPKQHTIFII